MNHQINERREYIMNKLKLNDIVIMKFDKNERACLGFVDSNINDEIVSISNFTKSKRF